MIDVDVEPEAAQREAVRVDAARLAAVQGTGLLDTEMEEVFDRLTRLAVRLVGVPAAFISLVDADRDFYKSACGFGEPLSTVRELTGPTFCHFTVQRTVPLVIPDTAADPLYRDVPTVKTLGVAAYVGVPLIISGQTVGAFCAIDTRPHAWSTDEVEVLVELAASAQREIELRGAIAAANTAHRILQASNAELERSQDQLQQQAVELEAQTEELQITTAHLEDRTEAAEAANHAKLAFLSTMSHELRTPLNAIGGYAELIRMGVRGAITPETEDFLGRIQRATTHLQTLIGEILEFTHLNAGEVNYELEDVSINGLIADAIDMLAPQIAEHAITFRQSPCEAPGGRCVARADRRKLLQIVINLVGNALKFTPRGGEVGAGAELNAGVVEMWVADSGRGIPVDRMTQIFEPFVQVDRHKTPERNQGVGLGLAISRQLARGMGGDITVTSEVGRGSRFLVRLPAA